MMPNDDSDDEVIDPIDDSDTDEDTHDIPFLFSMNRRGHGINRFTSSRPGQSPVIFVSKILEEFKNRNIKFFFIIL